MTKEDQIAIYTFLQFTKQTLGITLPFHVRLSTDRKKFKTFAYYNPETKEVAVYVKGRAIPDIMRSLAHELVHHFDHQSGLAQKKTTHPDVGVFHDDPEKTIEADDIENRANAIAGSLIKKFGYSHPELAIWGDKN